MAFGKKNKSGKMGKHGRATGGSYDAKGSQGGQVAPGAQGGFVAQNAQGARGGAYGVQGSIGKQGAQGARGGQGGAQGNFNTPGNFSTQGSPANYANPTRGGQNASYTGTPIAGGYVPAGLYKSEFNGGASNVNAIRDDYAGYYNEEPKHVGRKVLIGLGIFVLILLVIYIAGALIFSNKLFPNTTFNGEDVSLISTEELAKKLNNTASSYKLTVTSSNGYSQTITASDIGLQNASGSTMDTMVPSHNAWGWPVEVFRKRDISSGTKTSYDTAKLTSLVNAAVDNFNATAIQPVNANIAYDATARTFNITKETVGTALNKDLVLVAVTTSANELEEKLTLDITYLLQPTVLSSDARLQTALQTAQKMCKTNVTYTVGGTGITVLNSDVIAPMITMDAECNVVLDSNKLNDWAGGISDQLNTVGSTRTYTRPDGKTITVSGGAYGWIVDGETFVNQVRADAAEGTTKTVAVQCEQEGTGFLGLGQADWGKRYVDVDLGEQHVRFYDDAGNIIWETDCVSGAPTDNHSTPTGVWYVNAKESPSTLIGYTSSGTKEYETKVQFWMPFEGNGVGFHDATWQSAFGGTRYKDGYGSHGCINISYSAAETLYGIIQVNDVVIVHD